MPHGGGRSGQLSCRLDPPPCPIGKGSRAGPGSWELTPWICPPAGVQRRHRISGCTRPVHASPSKAHMLSPLAGCLGTQTWSDSPLPGPHTVASCWVPAWQRGAAPVSPPLLPRTLTLLLKVRLVTSSDRGHRPQVPPPDTGVRVRLRAHGQVRSVRANPAPRRRMLKTGAQKGKGW